MRTKKVNEFESASELVKSLLEKYPEARDNTTWLLILYWNSQSKGRLFWNLNGMKDIIFRKVITPAESVTRAKRLVQAQHPELRGNTDERHAIAEEVRQEIPRKADLEAKQTTMFND